MVPLSNFLRFLTSPPRSTRLLHSEGHSALHAPHFSPCCVQLSLFIKILFEHPKLLFAYGSSLNCIASNKGGSRTPTLYAVFYLLIYESMMSQQPDSLASIPNLARDPIHIGIPPTVSRLLEDAIRCSGYAPAPSNLLQTVHWFLRVVISLFTAPHIQPDLAWANDPENTPSRIVRRLPLGLHSNPSLLNLAILLISLIQFEDETFCYLASSPSFAIIFRISLPTS